MKAKAFMAPALCLIILAGCTLDNYDAPDASLYGTIRDIDTGDPIQSDLYNGTTLHYYEEGSVALQSMIVKCDGTYENSLMFSGNYKFIPVQTNFDPIDTVYVTVNGRTQMDFNVKPYIRISNVSIIKSGASKVTATFTVIPSSKFFIVSKVGLFIHTQNIVGAYMYLDSRVLSTGSESFTSRTYTIEFDCSDSMSITPGRSYYFRVGALAAEPNARYNYAPAEQVDL